MSVILVAGGVAVFVVGAAVGAALMYAMARDRFAAMAEAAERANHLITAQSNDALKDLGEALAKAEAVIGAIDTARRGATRAESSVAGLITRINQSCADLDKASQRGWLPSFSREAGRPAKEPPELILEPTLDETR